VKVTGLPVSPEAVAVRALAPAVVPSVQLVTAAIPLPLVVTGLVGTTVPPPLATANVTLSPATGLPCVSVTSTAGATATAVPAVALWPFPALTAIVVAAPAVPVPVNVTGPSAPAVAVSVLAPAVVPSVQLVTWAIPLASVLTGVVGSTVPPPPVTAYVTLTPATGLLAASRTRTEGGIVTAAPTVALCPFPPLSAIEAADPVVTVTVGSGVVTGEPPIVAPIVVAVPAATPVKTAV
jgi:hypothetical protein